MYKANLFILFLQFAALKALGAEGVEGTLGAEGTEALADIATVEEEPMVGIGGLACWGVLEEVLLYLVGGGAATGNESEAMAHAIDVGIDGHSVHAEGDCLHDVGGLASYAREAQQVVHAAGYLAMVVGDEHLGELHEVTCLGAGVGDATDVLKDLCLIR